MNWKDDPEFTAWFEAYARRVGHWIEPLAVHFYEAWKASREP